MFPWSQMQAGWRRLCVSGVVGFEEGDEKGTLAVDVP